MAEQGIQTILVEALALLRSDDILRPRLSNCWLPASTFVEALQKTGHIDATLTIDVRKFNTAMSKASFGSVMSAFDGSNQSGIFRIRYLHQFYYFFTEETRQATYPQPLNRAWKERVLEMASNVLAIPSTRARHGTLLVAPVIETSNNNQGVDNDEPSPNKRTRLESEAQPQEHYNYWPDSPEARHLFKPMRPFCGGMNWNSATAPTDDSTTTNINETAKEALQRRITLLQSVHEDGQGWRNVVLGGDTDNYCTNHEIFEIRQRSMFLCCAYQLALVNMNQLTWHECCKEACAVLNNLGLRQATYFKTVANWNKVFREFESFPHPNPHAQCGKCPLPRLLEVFPDAKQQIVSFGSTNLATLTIESLHHFIITTVLPRLAKTWMKEQKQNSPDESCNEHDNDEAIEDAIPLFLRNHGLRSMSLSTTCRWMHILGFDFDARKKSFYVDGHERADVVTARAVFCKRYLTEFEPRCKRWVQLPLIEAMSIKDIDIGFGYSYFDIIADKDMIEFHIDYWKRMTQPQTNSGGPPLLPLHIQQKEATTSTRVSPKIKPLMIIGQDESVFAQYLLGSKTWVAPNGKRPLFPKSEGDGYMLSAFVSREFGFGRQLTETELARINSEKRGADKTYADTVAAMEILKTTQKPLLVESPFVKYLYIGANNEGFWNSFHMSL